MLISLITINMYSCDSKSHDKFEISKKESSFIDVVPPYYWRSKVLKNGKLLIVVNKSKLPVIKNDSVLVNYEEENNTYVIANTSYSLKDTSYIYVIQGDSTQTPHTYECVTVQLLEGISNNSDSLK